MTLLNLLFIIINVFWFVSFEFLYLLQWDNFTSSFLIWMYFISFSFQNPMKILALCQKEVEKMEPYVISDFKFSYHGKYD